MDFEAAMRKIHLWLLRLPTLAYFTLVLVYCVAMFFAVNLAVTNRAFVGNRYVWILDALVLTAFLVSHLRFVKRHFPESRVTGPGVGADSSGEACGSSPSRSNTELT